jgi:phospholipid/cholesterol/gamma-HCH transport system ATP-binding protein
VVRQFLNGRRIGPIGMSEEKDESTMAEEQAIIDAGQHAGGVEEFDGAPPQITTTRGMPERKAVARRQARVRENLHTLSPAAQEAILDSLAGTHNYAAHEFGDVRDSGRHREDGGPTASIPAQRGY